MRAMAVLLFLVVEMQFVIVVFFLLVANLSLARMRKANARQVRALDEMLLKYQALKDATARVVRDVLQQQSAPHAPAQTPVVVLPEAAGKH